MVLSEDEVRDLLDLDDLRDALTVALISLSAGDTSVPPRVAAFASHGLLGAMPGYVPGLGLAAKLVAVFPKNAQRGLAAHQAVIVAFDEHTGTPIAVLDGTYITAARTGMTAALAARALARKSSRVLAILGAGVQGKAHLSAFSRLFALDEIRIASRDPASAADLARGHPAARVVSSFEEAARDADIVCCCTDSREPIVQDAWISLGTHVSSVGTGHELDAKTVDRAELFVEALMALQPPPAGALELQGRDPTTVTEIGAVLGARERGRSSDDAVTLYKSMGHAVEDVAAAAVVIRRARARGIGVNVTL
jgi:alanine dehydrogenase